MSFIYKNSINIISHQKPITTLSSVKNYQEIIKPLNGIEVGIPLCIFTDIYTNIHYGYNIINPEILILQMLIGFYTYGRDRYKDALEDYSSESNQNKIDLYNVINNNKQLYLNTHFLTLSLIFAILIKNNNLNCIPFVFLLFTTEYYKNLKYNFGYLKPFYVSFMWMISTIILPCVIHDNSFDIINYPMDYLPIILTIFSTSNLEDIKDINEDKINNISTLASNLGEENSIYLSLITLSIASLLFGINSHYLDRPLINSFFEFQNVGTTLSLIPKINNITKY